MKRRLHGRKEGEVEVIHEGCKLGLAVGGERLEEAQLLSGLRRRRLASLTSGYLSIASKVVHH